MNADVYDMAHLQGALVGAVHPFDAEPNPFANPPETNYGRASRGCWRWENWITWKSSDSAIIVRQRQCGTGC